MQAIQPPGQMQLPQAPGGDNGNMDLLRLLRAIMRFKWGILGLALVASVATYYYVSTLKPVYSAQASIVLEVQEANVVAVEDVYTLGRAGYDYFQTQFEILKSRSLAERVVRKLELHKHPFYVGSAEPAPDPWYKVDLTALLPAREKTPPVQLTEAELEEQRIRNISLALAGGLSVTPVEYSHVAHISYESTDRRLAAQIVNAVAEEFISSNLEQRLSGTVQATGWLNDRLETLRDNLRMSERALQDFRDEEGLVDVDGVTGLGSDELRMLSQRLQDATRLRIEAENIRREVSGLEGASLEEIMTIPAVLEHQLIRDLKREQSVAERRVAELAKRYGPKHPKMIAARSDLQVAEEGLAREVRKVVSGISREYDLALRNEQQLEQNWADRKTEMQEFNRIEFQLQELQREVDTNRQLYDIFFTRIKTVSETGGFEKPHARILDKAPVPQAPVWPDKRRSTMLAFFLAIMLGCGVALLLEMIDNTIKTPDDVQSRLNAPLLGTVPKMELDKQGDFAQFWHSPQSQYSEAIRTVRTNVLLSSLNEPAKVIVVTSTVPGEGKTTTVLNLGAALAQMEKVLVIGADMRRPSLAGKCGLAKNHQGLSHFVSSVAELDECIEYLEEINVHVMPAGIIPPNPLEMISSRKFRDALNELSGRFDRILLDSAPLQAVSDALVLASYANSVIYVVKADSTSASQAEKGINALVASNEPLTGVILNQFDAKKASGYYGKSYYYYGGYYQDEESPPA